MNELDRPVPPDVVPRQPDDDGLRALWAHLNQVFTGHRTVAVDLTERGEVLSDELGVPAAVGPPRVRRAVQMPRPIVSAAELRRLGLDPEQMTGLDVIDTE